MKFFKINAYYNVINNGTISKIELWSDKIHLLDKGKIKVMKNLKSSFNYF